MVRKPRGKSRKKIKNQQQSDIRLVEEASLRHVLMEKDLYRPGMKLKEMRDLCTAIEQSMQDNDVQPQISRVNESFLEDYLLRAISLPQEPSGSAAKVNDIMDHATPPAEPSPPKPPVSDFELAPVTSPEKTNQLAEPNIACWIVDSDSDGWYSPDYPGSCCRETHVVQVDIHPEPLTDDGDDEGLLQQDEATTRRINSPRKQETVLVNGWDSIDKLI